MRAHLPLHLLSLFFFFSSPSACSCLSTPVAFILSLLSLRHGNTKRHLPGRDKPILEMLRGKPDALASPSLHLSLSLSLYCSFSQGELHYTGLQAPLAPPWRVYSCVYVCLLFSGSACVCVTEVQRVPPLWVASQPDPWGPEETGG